MIELSDNQEWLLRFICYRGGLHADRCNADDVHFLRALNFIRVRRDRKLFATRAGTGWAAANVRCNEPQADLIMIHNNPFLTELTGDRLIFLEREAYIRKKDNFYELTGKGYAWYLIGADRRFEEIAASTLHPEESFRRVYQTNMDRDPTDDLRLHRRLEAGK